MIGSELKRNLKQNLIGRCFSTLSKTDRKKTIALSLGQVSLNILDLAGVVIFGVLGTLAVTGVQSQNPSGRVSSILRIFRIEDLSFQNQVAVLALIATAFLILRTLLSMFFTKKSLKFLSLRGAHLSGDLVDKYLRKDLLQVQQRNSQETLFALTVGATAVTVGVLGSFVMLISDLSLIFILTSALFFIDPIIAFSTLLIFSSIGVILYLLMHKKARALSYQERDLTVLSNRKILEVLSTYRETVVRNRQNYYSREIGNLRVAISHTQAEQAFLPNIGKYVIEIAVVLSALLVAGLQFTLFDASQAASTLAVFMAAGSRIAPAVLRFQQGLVSIKSNSAPANMTLQLIDELSGDLISRDDIIDKPEFKHVGFESKIEIKSACLTYPGRFEYALKDVNLIIKPGQVVALVGPSGAGKSSLADVILGVVKPDSGSVFISGESPQEASKLWPGAMSYLPQDVTLTEGTIRENVGLGYPDYFATDDAVESCLSISQLLEFTNSLPEGLDTPIGERGSLLSGGQRQRLGIARALFTNPRILLLDESTSALDNYTENQISNSIRSLKGSVTIILIAHRISTVLDADLVVYLEQGEILAQGTLQQVREKIPEFDQQVKLLD
jgi:ABC-type multidrug transport system fused ATPase/permease subunit